MGWLQNRTTSDLRVGASVNYSAIASHAASGLGLGDQTYNIMQTFIVFDEFGKLFQYSFMVSMRLFNGNTEYII